MTLPSPGWYPDASLPGYERWWDGNAWSPVTRAVPEQAGTSSVFGAPVSAGSTAGSQPEAGTSESTVAASEQGWGSPNPSAPTSGYPAPAGPDAATSSGQSGSTGEETPSRPVSEPGGQFAQPGQSYGSDPYASVGQSPYGTSSPGAGQYPSYPQPGGSGTPYGTYPGYPASGEPWPAAYGEARGPGTPASRFARLIARIVDGVLVGIVTAVLGISFLREMLTAVNDYVNTLPTDGSAPPDPGALLTDPAITDAITRYSLIALIVGGVYHVGLIALRGATLGKSLLGVKVQRTADQGRPTWTDALLRWATTDIPALIPTVGGLYSLLDALWCLWDPKRQCIHDKLPKTVVVRSR